MKTIGAYPEMGRQKAIEDVRGSTFPRDGARLQCQEWREATNAVGWNDPPQGGLK